MTISRLNLCVRHCVTTSLSLAACEFEIVLISINCNKVRRYVPTHAGAKSTLQWNCNGLGHSLSAPGP